MPDPTGNLKPEAQAIYDQITGKRGHTYAGLFPTLMHYPELAQRFAALGNLLRFDGVLRADLRELAILTVAVETQTAYIWETHQDSAKKAGLTTKAIADLFADHDPSPHDANYPAIVTLAQHFVRLEPIPQSLQDQLVAIIGYPGFVQLAVVIGYYHMIAGLAKGFEFPLPAGMKDPFSVKN